MVIVNESWTNLNDKLSIVGGKNLLSRINLWMKEEYKQSCSLNKILDNILLSEIDPEIKHVIDDLILR